ncbi:hypothetical protein R1flu_011573 [Riccia fluitans]|uniref:PRA1 family protein n=1 Tax=Riccia fluitans TaxID=41844 RepID=A0ABD1Z867_9MARC
MVSSRQIQNSRPHPYLKKTPSGGRRIAKIISQNVADPIFFSNAGFLHALDNCYFLLLAIGLLFVFGAQLALASWLLLCFTWLVAFMRFFSSSYALFDDRP